MRLRGSTGGEGVRGSLDSGERRFVCPARNFQESAVITSSFGSSDSKAVGLRERMAVSATLGLGILVLPCSDNQCHVLHGGRLLIVTVAFQATYHCPSIFSIVLSDVSGMFAE